MSEAEVAGPPAFIGLRRFSFTEPNLQDVMQELDVDDNSISHSKNGDAIRPQKRRRLCSETTLPSSVANYDDIVRSVYQLLGSQDATDLDGLHLVAM